MKADTAKLRAERTRYLNPDLRRRRATVRHQAFAASLIDRWTISIRYHDAESRSSGRDRRRQSCWPTANYKYIRIEHLKIHQRSNTSSEQKPGPAAARMLHVPAAGRFLVMNC